MSKHALAISPKPLVLLAGLEARQTAELSSALIQGGFRVVTAESEHEAAEAAQQDDQPHAILLDAGPHAIRAAGGPARRRLGDSRRPARYR